MSSLAYSCAWGSHSLCHHLIFMILCFDVVGYVLCAAIAQFYCGGIEHFVKFVMRRQMLLEKVKEDHTDISLCTHVKLGVEPDNIPLSWPFFRFFTVLFI